MKLSLRQQRLRLVWLLVVPFLYYARPTPGYLLAGGALALLGAAVRTWAAGYIRKDRVLCTGGPYARCRNPLYLGSFLIGLGVTVAGRQPAFVVLFLLFFVWAYGRTMRAEARLLEEYFGDAYRRYRAEVPLIVPRLTPYRPAERDTQAGSGAGGFSLARYRQNKEYEAALGILAGFAFLILKMILFT